MGFLHIKCPVCGRAKSFFTKQELAEFHCRCGKEMILPERLLRVHASCDCCERDVLCLTNRTEPAFTVRCFYCDAPVEVYYNERKRCYESA